MEDVPVPLMVDIISRLPVKTIIYCKCVCKKWLDLVSGSYFVNLHLSRSPAGFMIHHIPGYELTDYLKPGILKWMEVEDNLQYHHLHHDPVMSLDLSLAPILQVSPMLPVGSVDGLICLWQYVSNTDNYFICNPITREYMILPIPFPRQQNNRGYLTFDHGFGVGSQMQGYKLIRISRENMVMSLNRTSTSQKSVSRAEVYTLGTGQWRSLGDVPYRINGSNGHFLNGHAHWSVSGQDSSEKLYAFDFDDETFKFFPSPPIENREECRIRYKSLAVLQGCLCQCNTVGSQIMIWVMKEYGIKESWHKELVIKESCLMRNPVYLIKRLRDGTILMVNSNEKLLAYSCEKGTIADTNFFDSRLTGMPYRPSFLKLCNFESERVHVF